MPSKTSSLRLFEENVGLVEIIVNKMNYGFIGKEDLRQVGLMGLYRAAEKYDPGLGVKFNTFASYYIIGEIKKELRENRLIKLNRKLFRIIGEIKKNPGAAPEEIAGKLRVNREDVITAYNYLEGIASLNKPGVVEERELLDGVAAPDRRTQISEAVASLPAEDREIIFLRYFKNHTQAEVAKMKNASQSNISRAESRALEKMRKYLLGTGIQV